MNLVVKLHTTDHPVTGLPFGGIQRAAEPHDSHERALWAQAWMLPALLSWLLPLWKCEKSLMPHQLERSFFLLREGLMGVIILFIELGLCREAEPAGLSAVHTCLVLSAHLRCNVPADPVQTALLL